MPQADHTPPLLLLLINLTKSTAFKLLHIMDQPNGRVLIRSIENTLINKPKTISM